MQFTRACGLRSGFRDTATDLFESFRVVSGGFVNHLGDDVDRREYDADRRVDRRSLGVVAVAAAGVERRDRMSDDRDVFETAHHRAKLADNENFSANCSK